MNAGQSNAEHEVAPAGRLSQYKYAILPVGLTVVVSLAAFVFVRPYVGQWLEVRSAYQSLSGTDYDERIDAIRRLRSLGKETESELIALLHHSDEGVRAFAASELADRNPVTGEVTDAFLISLETNHHVAEIGHCAPALFFRHAEDATEPLTGTDRRMIAWLTPQLSSANPDRRGSAAWALTAFVNRDPSLQKPLAAYLKNGAFFYKYIVLREMANTDPSMRHEYVDLLLSGLGGSVHTDRLNAIYGLTHLEHEPDDLRSRLEARRKESTDQGEIARIDQVLKELRKNDAEQP